MPKFVRKVSVVEAVRWRGDNAEEVRALVPSHRIGAIYENTPLAIFTPHGTAHADVGDWVIKRAENDFYPCSNEAFVELYEEAE